MIPTVTNTYSTESNTYSSEKQLALRAFWIEKLPADSESANNCSMRERLKHWSFRIEAITLLNLFSASVKIDALQS